MTSQNRLTDDSATSLHTVNTYHLIDVSIVMPCLNEIETLPACIAEAQDTARLLYQQLHLKAEVAVSDNGSTDGSIEAAERMGARVIRVAQRGYGHAMRAGAERALGRYIVMADSDGSYDFHEAIPMVQKLMEGYDLCMGSRFKGTIIPGAMPWKNQHIGNPLLSGILNLLFHSGLSDAHSGIRAFTRSGFEKMHLTSSGMEFASEMVIKATLMNLKRTEIPVTLRPDGRSRPPHLRPWRDGWRHLRYILMLSPTGLFAIPSAIFGILGLTLFLLLLLNPDKPVVTIGGFSFGDHWMVIAGMLLVTSFQNALFAAATTLYGVCAGYRRVGRAFEFVSRRLNLETFLTLGVILVLAGTIITVNVFFTWSSSGYGSLSWMRQMIAGMTLILIGLQSFFGGFLLAIIGGNVANIYGDIVKHKVDEPAVQNTTGTHFISNVKIGR